MVNSSHQIINTDAVVIGQLNQELNRNRPRTLFIAAVDLPLDSEDVGNLLLGEVMIHSQIFNSLKLHHTTSQWRLQIIKKRVEIHTENLFKGDQFTDPDIHSVCFNFCIGTF